MCVINQIPEYTCLDENDSSDAVRAFSAIQSFIIKKAMRWVKSLSDHERAQYDLDDALQEIWLKLHATYHLYDPTKSKLITWAGYVVDHELLRLYGKTRLVGPKRYRAEWHAVDELPVVAEPHDHITETDDRDEATTLVNQAIQNLSDPRLARILGWTYGINGVTQLTDAEIEARRKISRQSLCRRRKQALEEVRAFLAERQ